MRIYNMYTKTFQDDAEQLIPNHLLVYNLNEGGEQQYHENPEIWEGRPVVFISITGKPIQNITFWNGLDPEGRYQLSFRYDGDLETAMERYLDALEEYENQRK